MPERSQLQVPPRTAPQFQQRPSQWAPAGRSKTEVLPLQKTGPHYGKVLEQASPSSPQQQQHQPATSPLLQQRQHLQRQPHRQWHRQQQQPSVIRPRTWPPRVSQHGVRLRSPSQRASRDLRSESRCRTPAQRLATRRRQHLRHYLQPRRLWLHPAGEGNHHRRRRTPIHINRGGAAPLHRQYLERNPQLHRQGRPDMPGVQAKYLARGMLHQTAVHSHEARHQGVRVPP